MNSIALCGIALICYAALLILGREKNGIGALVAIGGTLCLVFSGILSLFAPMNELKALLNDYEFEGSQQLLKAFGIGLCCDFTAQICKDAGYQGLADGLTFSCKVAILSLCMPLWSALFSTIGGLLL